MGVLVDGEAKVQLNPPLAATDKDAPQLSGSIEQYSAIVFSRVLFVFA